MKLFKKITTCILLFWGMVAMMIMCGENTDGTILKNIIVGGIHLAVVAILWRVAYRRNLIITEKDCNNDDNW